MTYSARHHKSRAYVRPCIYLCVQLPRALCIARLSAHSRYRALNWRRVSNWRRGLTRRRLLRLLGCSLSILCNTETTAEFVQHVHTSGCACCSLSASTLFPPTFSTVTDCGGGRLVPPQLLSDGAHFLDEPNRQGRWQYSDPRGRNPRPRRSCP